MPARTRKVRHDDLTRARIKASNIVTRLQKFIDGKIEMQPHQVTAALGLLKKALPDLTSVEHSGEIQRAYVVRAPAKVASMAEWQERYAPKPPTMQ